MSLPERVSGFVFVEGWFNSRDRPSGRDHRFLFLTIMNVMTTAIMTMTSTSFGPSKTDSITV